MGNKRDFHFQFKDQRKGAKFDEKPKIQKMD